MPRRGARRRSARRAPPPPPNLGQNIKVQLPPKPDKKVLKASLEAVVSASLEIRVQALMSVVSWYDEMSHYLIEKSRMDADLAKKLSGDLIEVYMKANKLRNQGVDTGCDFPERESFLRKAVDFFERYCSLGVDVENKDKKPQDQKPTPYVPYRLADYWKRYLDKKDALEAAEKRVQEKYQYLIDSMSKALPRAKFYVSQEISGRRFDGKGSLMYGKDYAQNLQLMLKREGLLKVVSSEISELAKVNAVAPNGQGGFFVDPKKWVEGIEAMFKDFAHFCLTAESVPKLVKRGQAPVAGFQAQPQTASKVQKQPGAPRPPRARATGEPKVAGRYEAGSAVAMIWQALSDEKEHSKKMVLAPFSHLNNPEGRLARLIREGKMFGEWTIKVNGDTVKMTILKQAVGA